MAHLCADPDLPLQGGPVQMLCCQLLICKKAPTKAPGFGGSLLYKSCGWPGAIAESASARPLLQLGRYCWHSSLKVDPKCTFAVTISSSELRLRRESAKLCICFAKMFPILRRLKLSRQNRGAQCSQLAAVQALSHMVKLGSCSTCGKPLIVICTSICTVQNLL